tara:strand:+ start:374 stop:715 length:342 start_codon:yes stop_codon:yes gene_type:complete
MAAFPDINPDYGIRKNSQPVVRKTQFGDGYQMRTVYGENQNLKKYNLTFKNLSETDSDTIETFLDARGGRESFDWTPPGEGSSSKFICGSWSKSIPYANIATITATFEQVAEV